jgi:hypothetical protein
MKILLLTVVLFWSFTNIPAEKTITCKEETFDGDLSCEFSNITITSNETISIKMDPEDADANRIPSVYFSDSSIFSVPAEVFTKFPNIIWFWARDQKIQEIKPRTFVNAKNLEIISMEQNAVKFLHRDTFEGKQFSHHIFPCPKY